VLVLSIGVGLAGGAGFHSKVTRKKSAGLRGRLTSTIRSINRSIAAGPGSDTEDSNSGAGGSSQRRARPSSSQGSQSILKEIRV
jgi:hypothetical protein